MAQKKATGAVKEWRTENSLLKFISDNIDVDGTLKDSADGLPDEVVDNEKIRYAPGLLDAMFGAEDTEESNERVRALAGHLKRIADSGDEESDRAFFDHAVNDPRVSGIIDQFLEALGEESLSLEPHLVSYARDLIAKSNKRNPVKFGIAILGLCQDASVVEDLKILGLHSEFSVYSTNAISNLSEDPVMDLWYMARKVDGWGKIHLVRQLAAMEINDMIRLWLLMEGYKNRIMNEYLAYVCAMEGRLHEELEYEQIGIGLFTASGDIIEALIAGGPAEDISVYMHAASAVQDFVRHAAEHAHDISSFNRLNKIKDFLERLRGDIGEHEGNGWTEDIISNCIIEVVEILNSRDWNKLAHEGLKSQDHVIYWNAKQAAEKLGIDLWETVWQRLTKDPANASNWYDVGCYAKPENVDTVVDLALKNLTLDETGPKDSLGFGPDFNKHITLSYVINFLENHPKKGERIVLAALRSRVTRNRNMAIRLLEKWKQENWSDVLKREVEHLGDVEPDGETKKNIMRLLAGEPLE